jgi:hypothetical protein
MAEYMGYDPHVEKTNESFSMELESVNKTKQANKRKDGVKTTCGPAVASRNQHAVQLTIRRLYLQRFTFSRV